MASPLPLQSWVSYGITLAAGIALGAAVVAAWSPSPLGGRTQADKEWYLVALAMYCIGHHYGSNGEACMPLLRDGTITVADLYAYRTAHSGASN